MSIVHLGVNLICVNVQLWRQATMVHLQCFLLACKVRLVISREQPEIHNLVSPPHCRFRILVLENQDVAIHLLAIVIRNKAPPRPYARYR